MADLGEMEHVKQCRCLLFDVDGPFDHFILSMHIII